MKYNIISEFFQEKRFLYKGKEVPSFNTDQELHKREEHMCTQSVHRNLEECKKNNSITTHIVKNGDSLLKMLGNKVYYNKKISVNGKNPEKQPKINLFLGDTVIINNSKFSKIVSITIRKASVVDRMAVESQTEIKNLPSAELNDAIESIPKISNGIFTYAEMMALAMKESTFRPNIKNGMCRIQKEYRPKQSLRNKIGATSLKDGALRDLEDATIHLVKYYGEMKNFVVKNNIDLEKMKIPLKELVLIAYNRGITNVKKILLSGNDPRVYRVAQEHKNYAQKILALSKNTIFLKAIYSV